MAVRRCSRAALCLAVLALASLAGCSRLTFIKPSAARGDSERVAPVYDFSDGERKRGSASVRIHLLRGEQALQQGRFAEAESEARDRKSTRLNSSHVTSSYAVFCLK